MMMLGWEWDCKDGFCGFVASLREMVRIGGSGMGIWGLD